MSIEKKAILDLANDEPIISSLFDYLAARQRHTSELTIDRAIKAVPGTSRSEMISAFRELEQIGLGNLLLGRKGGKTRLSWLVSPEDIEKSRMGELDPIPLSDSESDLDELDEYEDENEELITHNYQLRRDLIISIKLPEDLTERESSRLGQWLATLPFDQ